MPIHPRAGKPAHASDLINVAELVSQYYLFQPSIEEAQQHVSFGTSGHRGSAYSISFNDGHIAAISQAIAEFRASNGINGPVFIGKDTHALSEPAMCTCIEVLSANGINVIIQADNGFTPTPVISHKIVSYNRQRNSNFADGIVITPSHNPPQDGGLKYNPPHGGPADTAITSVIQERANQLIANGYKDVKRHSMATARASGRLVEIDFATDYIEDLINVVDMPKIAAGKFRLGADPLGGSGMHYWHRIAERYKLDIDVVNLEVDQRFAFMHLDKDGKIRMDCSSPYAMAGLINMKDQYDLAFGNDPDFDRHGIVTARSGLMNPNHYLACAIDYLFQHRPDWNHQAAIGKTLVSSSMIDRVASRLKRPLLEMPVGFKWFVEGLQQQKIAFAGEESAGGIFLRRDGNVWATDKDGFIMCLLAAEMMAQTGKQVCELYAGLTEEFGHPCYQRIDVPASLAQKQRLSAMSSNDVEASTLAGEAIVSIQTEAPGNQAKLGGVKVSTQNGWFAARPSGTENVYKIYAESFIDETHLQALITEAESLVNKTLNC